jgi:hypothetical protein
MPGVVEVEPDREHAGVVEDGGKAEKQPPEARVLETTTWRGCEVELVLDCLDVDDGEVSGTS